MSELQNRIIQRLIGDGEYANGDHAYSRQEQYLKAALSLYFSIGGSVDELERAVAGGLGREDRDIGDVVADILVETAAVSYSRDLDMVQAAFNWIDKGSPEK